MKKARTIVVSGREWKWKVGKSHVVVQGDDGKKRIVGFDAITGLPWSEIERGEWKKTFSITPKQVSEWLAKNG